jgi:hypothetical protein
MIYLSVNNLVCCVTPMESLARGAPGACALYCVLSSVLTLCEAHAWSV